MRSTRTGLFSHTRYGLPPPRRHQPSSISVASCSRCLSSSTAWMMRIASRIAARVLVAVAGVAELRPQVIDLVDDRALLGGRAIEARQRHVQAAPPVAIAVVAAVPLAPRRTETTVMAAVGVAVVEVTRAANRIETEDAESECEADHKSPFACPEWRCGVSQSLAGL